MTKKISKLTKKDFLNAAMLIHKQGLGQFVYYSQTNKNACLMGTLVQAKVGKAKLIKAWNGNVGVGPMAHDLGVGMGYIGSHPLENFSDGATAEEVQTFLGFAAAGALK